MMERPCRLVNLGLSLSGPMSTVTADLDARRHATNLSWLVRLRWGAFVSQALLVLAVDRYSAIALPVPRLLLLLGFGLATNVVLALVTRKRETIGESLLAGTLALDLVVLTSLLWFTGGPHNPFTALYLVHLALAPVVLGARWTWALVALSVGCYAFLFLGEAGLVTKIDTLDHATVMRIHLKGMWIAFTVAAVFIGYFLHKVQRARGRLEEELARARSREARSEKLSALATLAAGAAHELSTPLSIIAVAAKEMERRLSQSAQSGELLEDAALIREQIERCRRVLEQMAADAGASLGDGLAVVAVPALLEACREGLAGADAVAVRCDPLLRGVSARLPVRSLAMAVRGLLKNAIEASAHEEGIELVARLSSGDLVLDVSDRGSGMTAEVAARAGEPFFTTKPAGKGMGLGLFLAGAVAEHLGGALRVRSQPNEGTTVTVHLPARVLVDATSERPVDDTSNVALHPIGER
jgi:two-component system sensor histidine kinase RegB